MNIVLMASGTGTNALNLLEYSYKLKNVSIVAIIVNKKSSALLNHKLSIPVIYIPKTKAMTNLDHEKKIIDVIHSFNGKYILLCGYMSLLSNYFIDAFTEKNSKNANIFNIHPSLLPKFKGAHAYENAFNSNEKTSGVTIHFVNSEMDAGEIFLQKSFERTSTDTLETFIAKGKKIEWEIYPKVLDWLENQ